MTYSGELLTIYLVVILELALQMSLLLFSLNSASLTKSNWLETLLPLLLPQCFLLVLAHPPFLYSPLSLSSILSLILSSPNKTCYLDPIPTWLVAATASELAPFIALLVNSSLTPRCFPSSFKSAVVTPVLKKSNLDPFDISNYRPISNLSFLSKLLERVVSSQLLDYLNSNS